MQKFSLLFLLCMMCLMGPAVAQEVRRQQQNLQGQQHQGYSFRVSYPEHQAKRYWLAYLKERGKITERRQFIEIKEIYWFNPEKGGKPAISTLSGDSTKTDIWIGYPAAKPDSLLDAGIKEQLQKLPFLMKKYQLMASLKDAEDAANFLNREVESSRRQESRLETSLKRNAEEKLKLEQQLVKNGEDKLRLEQEIKDNKLKQEKQQAEAEQVNKQLQALKDKLSQLKE